MARSPIFEVEIREDAQEAIAFQNDWRGQHNDISVQFMFNIEKIELWEDYFPPFEALEDEIKTYSARAKGYDVELLFALVKKTKTIVLLKVLPVAQDFDPKEIAYYEACKAFGLQNPARQTPRKWFDVS